MTVCSVAETTRNAIASNEGQVMNKIDHFKTFSRTLALGYVSAGTFISLQQAASGYWLSAVVVTTAALSIAVALWKRRYWAFLLTLATALCFNALSVFYYFPLFDGGLGERTSSSVTKLIGTTTLVLVVCIYCWRNQESMTHSAKRPRAVVKR